MQFGVNPIDDIVDQGPRGGFHVGVVHFRAKNTFFDRKNVLFITHEPNTG